MILGTDGQPPDRDHGEFAVNNKSNNTGSGAEGGFTSHKLVSFIRCAWKYLASITLGLLLLVLLYAAIRFLPQRAVTYDTMEDHFKYGSIGGDLVTGIPFWMWQAMPLVCANTLKDVAGARLAPDYVKRAAFYSSAQDSVAKRRELSREGYKALGFLYERDADGRERDLPIGISQRRSFGLDRVYINCAICHTSTVRKSPEDAPALVLGMPANLFNLYDFEHFVFQCGQRGRYTQLPQLDFIPEMQSLGADLGLIDRYIVYPLAIWAVQDAVHFLDNVAGFSVRQPDWGPGRNDTFTNNKIYLYGYPWREVMPDWWTTGQVDPEGIGIVDWPSIWLQGKRKLRADGKPMQLHWDGNNDMVEERNLNASLATSALPPVIDHESLECIEQWLETLEPPKYPFEIDKELAQKGEPVYKEYCAECHGRDGRDFEGQQVGFVTSIEQLGTDAYRLNNYTESLALNMATTYAEQKRELRAHDCPGGTRYQPRAPAAASAVSTSTTEADAYVRLDAVSREEATYRYKHYRKTNGYANAPLDGVWLRAPYLHNGSVPTLRDLLQPADKRPATFYRGNNVYDPVNVGFIATEPLDSEGKDLFLFDTAIPGNGNQGHEGEAFGTDLSGEEKEALLEYLKTF